MLCSLVVTTTVLGLKIFLGGLTFKEAVTRPRVAELETDVGKRNNLSQSLQLGEQECWYILCSLHKFMGATRPYKSRQCVRITTDRRKVDIVDIIYRGTTLLAAKLAGVVHMLCCSTDPPLALQPVHTL